MMDWENDTEGEKEWTHMTRDEKEDGAKSDTWRQGGGGVEVRAAPWSAVVLLHSGNKWFHNHFEGKFPLVQRRKKKIRNT